MMNLVPLLTAVQQEPPQHTPEGSLFFPPKASNFAAEADWLYNFIFWVSLIAFALTIAATVILVLKYRKSVAPEPQPSPHHSTKLEIIWSVIPSIFLVIMFWKGFELFVDYRKVPANAYQIRVEGLKWSWQFTYPNGARSPELHVPKDRPVKLLITSQDVLHSVFIPAFRVKQDAVPGRYTSLWFEATLAGKYPFYCTEYCGTSHSGMKTFAFVHETDESFNAWLEKASNPYTPGEDVANGEIAVRNAGCLACHKVDEDFTGPKFGGLFGSERTMVDGSTVIADENYIRESILEPQAKSVAGFNPNGMPASVGAALKPEELDYIVAYLESLKDAN